MSVVAELTMVDYLERCGKRETLLFPDDDAAVEAAGIIRRRLKPSMYDVEARYNRVVIRAKPSR